MGNILLADSDSDTLEKCLKRLRKFCIVGELQIAPEKNTKKRFY